MNANESVRRVFLILTLSGFVADNIARRVEPHYGFRDDKWQGLYRFAGIAAAGPALYEDIPGRQRHRAQIPRCLKAEASVPIAPTVLS